MLLTKDTKDNLEAVHCVYIIIAHYLPQKGHLLSITYTMYMVHLTNTSCTKVTKISVQYRLSGPFGRDTQQGPVT